MFCLYKEKYQAALGEFELRINSSLGALNVEPKEHETLLLTVGHQIKVRRVQAPTDWLPEGMSVSAAEAWMFYIQKHDSVREQLTFTFSLVEASADILTDADTGQYLVAIEFENGIHQAHIGTQDEDLLASRAEKSDWVPKRLAYALGTWSLIVTTIEKDGLTTQLPELLKGERFYFHYILAESPRRKSEAYPDSWDVSTWCAVNQSKEVLEQAWSQQTKKPPQ